MPSCQDITLSPCLGTFPSVPECPCLGHSSPGMLQQEWGLRGSASSRANPSPSSHSTPRTCIKNFIFQDFKCPLSDDLHRDTLGDTGIQALLCSLPPPSPQILFAFISGDPLHPGPGSFPPGTAESPSLLISVVVFLPHQDHPRMFSSFCLIAKPTSSKTFLLEADK